MYFKYVRLDSKIEQVTEVLAQHTVHCAHRLTPN